MLLKADLIPAVALWLHCLVTPGRHLYWVLIKDSLALMYLINFPSLGDG